MHFNASAALANLAPYLAHLHVHAAQRLISLLQVCAGVRARARARVCVHARTCMPSGWGLDCTDIRARVTQGLAKWQS